MPSDQGSPPRVFVWTWLPGHTEPVVASALALADQQTARTPTVVFTYATSYRDRADAISLFPPELPLERGTFDPTTPGRVVRGGLSRPFSGTWRGTPAAADRSPGFLAGCLRDAAPDAWGRRVINMRVAADPNVDLTELTYLMNATSDRIGALDFQDSPDQYRPRGEQASLIQLVEAAERIESGEPLPEDLEAAAGHGTSIGGARPKALLEDGDRRLVAKFSSTTDDRPVVKAEAVGMLLAARLGLDVAAVEVTRSNGRDVLLVERFDRAPGGGRKHMISALTLLGLREEESRYATYVDLAHTIRQHGFAHPEQQLRELFTRLVLNIAISNNDDHLRNHAVFWNGSQFTLTPSYDLAPQRRNTHVSAQAIGITATERASQFRVAVAAAGHFNLSRTAALDIVDKVKDTIHTGWEEVCDLAQLTATERRQLWGREILNDYASWDQA